MEELNKEQSYLVTASLLILASVAIGFVLQYSSSIMIPFTFAVFIVQLVSPILDYQVIKLNVSRKIAIATSMLLVIIILAVICVLLVNTISILLRTANSYTDTYVGFIEKYLWKSDLFGIELDRAQLTSQIRSYIPRIVSGTFGTIMSFLSKFTLVSIFVMFLLIGRNPYVIQKGIYAEIDHQVRKYLIIKTIMSILTGILVWAILSAFNLKLAVVFGTLAFLLNYIPSLGSIIASILPVPVVLAQFSNPWMAAAVIASPAVVEFTIGNVIEPRILGKGLNLHPVTVLFSLTFWGLLWGVPGMFLAAPITAIIRIILMQFETLRPAGMLLAGHLPERINNSEN
ncbi:Transport of quorum-sensing signal protein [Sedimentisphaera cyanobacteriorum]|uniref:Transport of quorum-sensing signal protein n=1 Tax=Sedimentisphaera cyanobacteriorum TaxID=1940790 RepID=A0A1Q2HSH2_9BACT|nr:AI-2E family transporter [Sedimentisphaera cyanobacteriorum]AQQ10281.1 Transport of quorum-sensing signal protein [Sedimentisphaera cyanobacteriorum]